VDDATVVVVVVVVVVASVFAVVSEGDGVEGAV